MRCPECARELEDECECGYKPPRWRELLDQARQALNDDKETP